MQHATHPGFIAHGLTNSTGTIFQSDIIDSENSEEQLIFCTTIKKQVKFNKRSNVLLRSLKHYTVNLFP